MSLERVSAAKLWLTASAGGDVPYLSSALYSMPTIESAEVDTISADDDWRVYVNPLWEAPVPEVGAHLAHLVWHLLRDHAGRGRSMGIGAREASAWATAGDLTISQTLDAAGHPLPTLAHPAALRLPLDRAVEEYYLMLERRGLAEKEVSCGSAADGQRRSYQVLDGGIDQVLGEQLRQQVAIEFAGHMSGRGSQPGEWSRWVEQVLEPKVSWQQVLSSSVRRAVAFTAGSTHPTYRRLSRRQAASPRAVLPGSQRAVPAVAIVVDTSGSMDDGLLAQALGEVDGVLQSLGTAVGTVQVYSCDAAVSAASTVRRARDLQLVGGGGTDLRVGITAAVAGRPRPEVVIVLTDGDTPWPAVPPAGCAVVGVLITRRGAPACPPWVVRVECGV